MNNNINFDRNQAKRLLLLAILAGRIMLKNGAETYRVEDTIERMIKSRKGIKFAHAFVTPTGIFASLEYEDEVFTYLVRIKSRRIDLNKINLVNEFSREFVSTNMSIDEGFDKLKSIYSAETYSLMLNSISGGLSCGFLSFMFGGSTMDFLASLIIGFIVVLSVNKIARYKLAFFINNFLGAAIATLLSIVSYTVGIADNMNTVIIASIMPLVPGVAITNAMRDTISGDFVSGLSRGMEAIFSALSIAFGVGFILNIYLWRIR
ncbi:MAG TPA: threonine/serine exporter family protein [Tissierellia bacterium]|nr:threonine/serine exporter family protein [Tissierellia bacterium]